ncbi:MAG: helix-turn-helix domain-containing protein [Omnitrophica WOR_2 bacterium]
MYHRIGRRLKDLRKRAKMTLYTLAEVSGLSPSYLCKLEAAKVGVSVANLRKIASALSVDITTLISEEEVINSWVTRAGFRNHFALENGAISEQLIPAVTDFGLSSSLYTCQPGFKSNAMATHRGDDFEFVVKGSFKFNLDGQDYILKQGDSISNPANTVYHWENIGDEEGILLIVSTMPCNDERHEKTQK